MRLRYLKPASLPLLVVLWAHVAVDNGGLFAQPADRFPPTEVDVSYGPHERHVLDFWKADADKPTPLVIYFHGAPLSGDKAQIIPDEWRELVNAGISVAAANYRLLGHAKWPAAHRDGRRALQFLRAQAATWNVDADRIGLLGVSSGAQIAMWLAFHDDMAQPDNPDPVSRQSTRVTCVATLKRFSDSPCTAWARRGTSACTNAGGPMQAYSMDLRERALLDSDAGMKAADVAVQYRVSGSWVRLLKQRRRETGEVAPRVQRHGRRRMLEPHLHTLAALIAEQPDRTLAELKDALGTPASLATIWRAVAALDVTVKKNGPALRTRST